MSSDGKTDPAADAAEALRAAAADLIERAEALEAAARERAVPEPEPLEPATDEDEANARLVALDLSTRGVDRSEAERLISEQFPAVDAGGLLDRFYRD